MILFLAHAAVTETAAATETAATETAAAETAATETAGPGAEVAKAPTKHQGNPVPACYNEDVLNQPSYKIDSYNAATESWGRRV